MVDRPASAAVAIAGISLFLLLITLLSYPLVGHGALSFVLFWLGMGGEINVGAWWSGMLFLLSAVFALDLAVDPQRRTVERRGWGALAAAFALLSFDEIASLHEFLSARSHLYLVPLGLLGFGLVAYGLAALHRARALPGALLWAFLLLATVPAQEFVQGAREWNSAWVYGLRAFVEEGTEILAALLMIAATLGARSTASRVARFDALIGFSAPLVWLGAAVLPIAAAATYSVNFRGPGNWLGSSLFLLCALVAARGRTPVAAARTTFYLLASLAANAVSVAWEPHVLGVEVNLRALCFGLLLAAAPWALSARGPWRRRVQWLLLGGLALVGSFVFPSLWLVWSMLPPAIALRCLYKELGDARRAASVRESSAPTIPLDTVLADKTELARQP